MNYSQQADKLAGPIGLLKQYGTFPTIQSKYSKFPGLYLGLGGKQQKVKPLRKLPSFYPLLTASFIDATQVFGGRALTVTGMGKLIENVIFSFAYAEMLNFNRFLQCSTTAPLVLMLVSVSPSLWKIYRQ